MFDHEQEYKKMWAISHKKKYLTRQYKFKVLEQLIFFLQCHNVCLFAHNVLVSSFFFKSKISDSFVLCNDLLFLEVGSIKTSFKTSRNLRTSAGIIVIPRLCFQFILIFRNILHQMDQFSFLSLIHKYIYKNLRIFTFFSS